jgi:DNA-binding transcriptional ArsR family regulator
MTAVLDTLGDEISLQLLAALKDTPQSVATLAQTVEVSQPTVYRRLEDLKDQNLVTTTDCVGEDGNHYTVYKTTFEKTVIRLEANGEYTVSLRSNGNLSDNFSHLWTELSRG